MGQERLLRRSGSGSVLGSVGGMRSDYKDADARAGQVINCLIITLNAELKNYMESRVVSTILLSLFQNIAHKAIILKTMSEQ